MKRGTRSLIPSHQVAVATTRTRAVDKIRRAAPALRHSGALRSDPTRARLPSASPFLLLTYLPYVPRSSYTYTRGPSCINTLNPRRMFQRLPQTLLASPLETAPGHLHPRAPTATPTPCHKIARSSLLRAAVSNPAAAECGVGRPLEAVAAGRLAEPCVRCGTRAQTFGSHSRSFLPWRRMLRSPCCMVVLSVWNRSWFRALSLFPCRSLPLCSA